MRLTIENFRAHSYKVVEVPDVGTTLISGTSGIGKTTILEAIAWCLYGSKSNVYPISDKKNKKAVPKVSLEMMFRNQLLVVERRKKPDTVIVHYNGVTAEATPAQDFINQYLGSKDMFYMSSYLVQGERNRLLSLSQQERLELLRQIALPDNSDILIAKAEEKCKELAQDRNKSQQEYDLNQEALQRYMLANNFRDTDYMNKKERQELLTATEELKERLRQRRQELTELQKHKHHNDILEAQIRALRDQKEPLQDQYSKVEIDLEPYHFCYTHFNELNEYFKEKAHYQALPNPDPDNLAELYPERDNKAIVQINHLLIKYNLSPDCDTLLATYDKLVNASRILNKNYRTTEFDRLPDYRQQLTHLKHVDYYKKRLAYQELNLEPDHSLNYYQELSKKQEEKRKLQQDLALTDEEAPDLEFFLANLKVIELLKDINQHIEHNNTIWQELNQESEITEQAINELIAELHQAIHDLKIESFHCPQCQSLLYLEGSEAKLVAHDRAVNVDDTEREQRLSIYQQMLVKTQKLIITFQKFKQLNEQVPENIADILANYKQYKALDINQIKQFLALIDLPTLDCQAYISALETKSELEIYQKKYKLANYELSELRELSNLSGSVVDLEATIKELENEIRDYSIYQQLTKEAHFEEASQLNIDHKELKQLQNWLYQFKNTKWLKTLPNKDLKLPNYEAIQAYYQDCKIKAHLAKIESKLPPEIIEKYETIYQEYHDLYPELQQKQQAYEWSIKELANLNERITKLSHQLSSVSEKQLTEVQEDIAKLEQEELTLAPKLKLVPIIEYYAQEYNNCLKLKRQIKNLDTQLIEHRELLQIMKETEFECLEHNIININNIIERILEQLFNTNMRVELSVFKMLKNESQRLNINLKINKAGYDFDSINQLSGGEADRISFAITLAMNIANQQPLLLLDEPSSSLDEINRKKLLEILNQFITDKPVLCINHEDPIGFYDHNYNL